MNATDSRDLHAILQKVGTGILLGASILLAGCPHIFNPGPKPKPSPLFAVTTYHYDNLRSGWNQQESHLTYSNVKNSSLSVLVVKLDDVNDQVDTQPLIVPNLQIDGGTHDVVYVTTEANNIYAFDANTGARLNTVNLGPPVPKPQGCFTNGPTVGIDGTPVIDLAIDPQSGTASGTMYVIAFSLDSSKNPAYSIHALDLATLTDKKAQPITATQTLSDGTSFKFNAAWQRQRPGLLLSNGNVYAGFGSVCDGGDGQSRGWVMGWQTPSLAPLPVTLLANSQTSEPNGMFLTGVWMSGYGIAGDQKGNIYFSTGNSDYSGKTYDGDTNIQDSVVKLKSNLTRPSSQSEFLFTPGNVATLDLQDLDLSAGGVMLLPPQSGPVHNLVAATSKDGRMFLLNSDNLGGFTPNDAGAFQEVNIGACWCGPSYFNDGSPHIVSSGGTTVGLWDLQMSPTPKLTQSASATLPPTVQLPGSFTTVSSSGNSNAIIWAVSRPQNSQNPTISLYAFKATPSGNALPQLFQSVAGSWPSLQANANIVPVVANGKVYVASYKELDIFAPSLPAAQGAQKVKARAKALVQVQGPQYVKGPEEHQVCGIVRKIDGNHLTIQTRDSKTVGVDATEAKRLFRYPAVIPIGGSVVAAGSYDANGVLQAVLVWGLKPSPTTWPPDR